MRSQEIRSATLAAGLVAALCLSATKYASADDKPDRGRKIVTVAFGAGINTAQPGNAANHHIVPQVIRISPGDIVNFVVGGVHVIRAYEDGVRLGDVKLHIPDECEENPAPPGVFPSQCFFGAMTAVPVIPTFGLDVYYEGLNPFAAPPTMPPPPFTVPSTAINRVEPVVFSKPGRFLVICAVLPHFNDAMYALVDVRADLDSVLEHGDDHSTDLEAL